MYLARLRLRNFRNYARLDVELPPGLHLFLGNNAQGKTNLLEAIYLLVTLRSFRGVGGAQMLRQGQTGYFLGARIVSQQTHDVRLYWSARERALHLDGRPIRRLTDYLGVLRGVVFCAEDMQLIKGTARVRRRFMDLLLAQTAPGYLAILQRYTQVLRSRNALLKEPSPDPTALEGFTRELVRLGNQLRQFRQELIPRFLPFVQEAHRWISGAGETIHLEYQPSVRGDFAVELANARRREQAFHSTLLGPHRDELGIRVQDQPAEAFASEGQKRTLAISLKMAQAALLMQCHGTPPLLLLDDVMGELDAQRRRGLLPLLTRAHESHGQVFMTCTEESWPQDLGRPLIRWRVHADTLTRLNESARLIFSET